MRPDWGSNSQPLSVWDNTPTNWASSSSPGQARRLSFLSLYLQFYFLSHVIVLDTMANESWLAFPGSQSGIWQKRRHVAADRRPWEKTRRPSTGLGEVVHRPPAPCDAAGQCTAPRHCHSPAATPASHQWGTGTPESSDEQRVTAIGTRASPRAAAWAEGDSRDEIYSFLLCGSVSCLRCDSPKLWPHKGLQQNSQLLAF